jgi:Yip1 domain
MLSLNPWISIWIHPKKTIQQVIAYNPNFRIWVLATIIGFATLMLLEQIFSPAFKYSLRAILTFTLILSPFWGYFVLNLVSFLTYKIGKIMDSKRSFSDVRAALSWSCVPYIIICICWIVMLMIFKGQLFKDFPQNITLKKWHIETILIISLVKLSMSVYSLIIYIQALAYVQEFSIKKTLLNLFFVGGILTTIIFLLWTVIVNTCGYFFDIPLITFRS